MGVGHGLAVGELYTIARKLAWRYRHVAEAELEEAVQAAVVAMLGALRQLRESPADPVAYVRRVAHLTVQGSIWRQKAPVTIGTDGERPRIAAALSRADVSTEMRDVPTTDAPADELLEAQRWARAVRRRVREVIGNDPPADREVARLVLLEDHRPAEAAQEVRRPLSELYVVTQRIKQRLLKDARTRELWRDMPSREEEDAWE